MPRYLIERAFRRVAVHLGRRDGLSGLVRYRDRNEGGVMSNDVPTDVLSRTGTYEPPSRAERTSSYGSVGEVAEPGSVPKRVTSSAYMGNSYRFWPSLSVLPFSCGIARQEAHNVPRPH
jgi:hypothetical protein